MNHPQVIPLPSCPMIAQQVAHVHSGHGDLVGVEQLAIRRDAIVESWARIADQRALKRRARSGRLAAPDQA